jgi:choline dehydrogenase-like flavoprotein
MVYFRGSERDFDIWENDYGLEGWGYNDVLPYFIKYENNEDVPNSPIHGYSGPINISMLVLSNVVLLILMSAIVRNHFPPSAVPVTAWKNAALSMGYPNIVDSSDPTTVYDPIIFLCSSCSHLITRYGASDSWQTFVGSNGRRSDSSTYIDILDKQGKVCWNQPKSKCTTKQTLSVWNGTHVTKVLIDANKRAYGVEYAQGVGLDRTEHPLYPPSTDEATKNNYPYNKWDKTNQLVTGTNIGTFAERLGAPVAQNLAYNFNRPYDQYIPESSTAYTPKNLTAKYEVILAAGAIVTPQLLMLSGIGPKDHLAERGIPLVQDLPVGTHTNDHQEVFTQWKFNTLPSPFNVAGDLLTNGEGMQNFTNGLRSFYSSSEFVGGLDGSSAGPTGTIPKWHMHHLMGGAFENVDWQISSYSDTINLPYRVPRSLAEILAWKGLQMHGHGCELSGV